MQTYCVGEESSGKDTARIWKEFQVVGPGTGKGVDLGKEKGWEEIRPILPCSGDFEGI